ncbi:MULTISPECIES: alpha/beta hydrolase [unclassified Ensifer]|uniref:alpha/beta fold hydrolase n=1 Tax=unclassified Ensifer TaxID=2633371 RepID=UPI00070F6EF0|nr:MULTISPECIES: alpha/beta hydrolase [unclassified Ensifer]KQW44418.1 hydrolase [Ensifer sp. Root1252]KRC58132.1 hydrolase [Ensifer sp. Root231]KRC93407.1 hydrolase [Ensifer sp. Root258]
MVIDQQSWAAAKRRIELPGGQQFTYVDHGQGPVLLLLHGYSDTSRSFSLIAPSLGGYRLIIPDLGGHGGSMPREGMSIAELAHDVDCLADRLAIHQFVLVGHSMGAMIAVDIAARRREAVRALILLSGSLKPDFGPGTEVARAIRGLKDPLGPDDAFFDRWHACSRSVDTAFLRHLRREAAAMPMTTWRTLLDALAVTDLKSRAAHVRAPVLCIAGAQDPLFDIGHRQVLAETFASVRSITLDGHGHNPHWESPADVAALILSFLGDEVGQPGSTSGLSATHGRR